jgi:hypothetical protein
MTPSCPRCGFTHAQRSTRRLWERLFRLRAFRCVACYHRFRSRDDTGFWRIINDPCQANTGTTQVTTNQPEHIGAAVTETVSEPVLASVETSSAPMLPARQIPSDWVSAVRLVSKPKRDWRLVASVALLGIAVVILAVWALPRGAP